MINHTKRSQILHMVVLGIFFVLHFTSQIFFILIGMVTSTMMWEEPSNIGARAIFDVRRSFAFVLWFPVYQVVRYSPLDRFIVGQWAYVQLLANSALWTFALSLLLKKRTR